MNKVLEVVCAIIFDSKDNIFCTRRSNHGQLALKWEFPGGKVESDETHEQALFREIKEELSTNIVNINEYMSVIHDYQTFTIHLHAYTCNFEVGDFTLNDHIECLWIKRDQLLSLDWAEADLFIVKKLMEGHTK